MLASAPIVRLQNLITSVRQVLELRCLVRQKKWAEADRFRESNGSGTVGFDPQLVKFMSFVSKLKGV